MRALILLALLCAMPAFAVTEDAVLYPDDTTPGHAFAIEVQLSGDTAISGAHRHTINGKQTGAAYIFKRCESGGWKQDGELLSADSEAGDFFGWTVSVSGDTAIVGAHKAEGVPALSESGSAYIFVRQDGTWVQQAKLLPNDPVSGGWFGWDVWIDGDTAVVGSVFDSQPGGIHSGSAYVFKRANGIWSQQAKLTAPHPAQNDEFGRGVNVSGDLIIVGAAGHETTDGGADRCYVYHRTSGVWSFEAELKPPDASDGKDRFGINVALSGNTAIIGAEYHDGGGQTDAGGAYIFTRNSGAWTLQAELLPSDPHEYDHFGFCAEISGDVAVVGAINGDTPQAKNSGAAYVFKRQGTTWTQAAKLTASDPHGGDAYANTVAVSGDTVLVGAVNADEPAIKDVGKTYVYDVNLTTPRITSTYPIRGTAPANSTVLINLLQQPCGTPFALSVTQADATGAFVDLTDTRPYEGQYLSAVAVVNTQSSRPSTPVLITSPCPLPTAPSAPYPADGATLSADNPLTFRWYDPGNALPGKTAGWEGEGEGESFDCATPVDFAPLVQEGPLYPWDGQAFAADGLAFQTATGGTLSLFPEYSSGRPGIVKAFDGPVEMHFVRPVPCVAFDLYGVPSPTRPWTITTYDHDGKLISTQEGTTSVDHVRLQVPGAEWVKFDTHGYVSQIGNISYDLLDCPSTFDTYLGTSPGQLALLCSNTSATTCDAPRLVPGITYYWKVVARNAKGTTSSPVWSFKAVGSVALVDDTYTVPFDATNFTISPLANDIGTNLHITSFTEPSSGALGRILNYDSFWYTPGPTYVPQVTFTYTVDLGTNQAPLTATVTINITRVNHAPVVQYTIPDLRYEMNAATVAINVGLVFADPDGDPLTYFVFENTNPGLVTATIQGSACFLTFAPNATGTAQISLIARDTSLLTATDTFTLTVTPVATPPSITQQPNAQTVNATTSATFTCAATSDVALTYAWQKDGFPLTNGTKYTGADTPQLTVYNCLNADEGQYRCHVATVSAAADTDPAALTVVDPYIAVQPADTHGGVGGTAAFEVTAVGTAPITYRWYIGSTALSDGAKYAGTTTNRLSIRNLVDKPGNTDEAYYRCIVRGADVQATSTRQALLRIGDPDIALHPTPLVVRTGSTATFHVLAEGTAPLLYRWKRNGAFLQESARVSGTTTDTLTITGATDADAGTYSCVVIGQEIVESNTATLTVAHFPRILGLRLTPASGIVARGAAFSIELLLDEPATGYAISWHRDGTPLSDGPRVSGANTAVLNVTSAQPADTGDYTCTLTLGSESDSSPAAAVHVGLAFAAGLSDQSTALGRGLTWPVAAEGATGALHYTWFRVTPAKSLLPLANDGRILGVTTDTLRIDPVQQEDAGTYVVYAADDLETAASRNATLTVSAELPAASVAALAGLAGVLALALARSRRRDA